MPAPVVEKKAEPEKPKVDMKAVHAAAAKEAVASGKQGTELKEFVLAQDPATSGGALLLAALTSHENAKGGAWADDSQYGLALKALAGSDKMKQLDVLYGAQQYANDQGFPKFEAKNSNLVTALFMFLYHKDVCEEDAYLEWKDDVNDSVPGKTTAIIQTMFFFEWLEAEEEEEESDEEEEEIPY
ncbi:unnamed protein product [Chrysoparadoxa australica]